MLEATERAKRGHEAAHSPNTVTYHELISALLKTGKEAHRPVWVPK